MLMSISLEPLEQTSNLIAKLSEPPVHSPRYMELGSGKVAGKVLIVDHMLCSAKLLILVDSVTC